MMQVALIGVTGYGGAHYAALRELEGEGVLKIAAATIINRDETPQAAEAWEQLESAGCRIYVDYQEMLRAEAGRIDLCCVPTGIAWHCPMTVAALEAGCHVLVEKPVAATLEEVETMITARDSSGRRVFVGYQDLYLPPVRWAKERILAGAIGEVESVAVMACWPRPVSYYERNHWAGCIKSGGNWVYDSPANNALAHYVIGALYLTAGEMMAVDRVVAGEAELYRAKPIESFDTLALRARLASGTRATIILTHSSAEARHPVIRVQGSAGSIRWDFNDQIVIEPGGERIAAPAGPHLTTRMIQAVADGLKRGRPAGCTLEMAREHTRLINALHAQCPIHAVGPDHRQETVFRDSPLIAIPGIEAAAEQALGEGKLFAELGLPWTRRATAFQL